MTDTDNPTTPRTSSPPADEPKDTFARLKQRIGSLNSEKELKAFVVQEAGPYRATLRSCPRRDRGRRVWPAIIQEIEQQLQIDLTGRHGTVETYLSSPQARASAMAWEQAGSGKSSSGGGAPSSPAEPTPKNPFLGKR